MSIALTDINPAGNPLVEDDTGPALAPRVSWGSGKAGGAWTGLGSGPGQSASRKTTATTVGTTATSFAGPSFTSVGATNGYYMIPPDNASAAGPNNVVVATNGEIEVLSKTGTVQLNQSLVSFFKPLNPLSNFSDPNQTQAFDPKVVYDATSGRFVVVALEQSDAGGTSNDANTSRILIAVSNGGDPSNPANWSYTSVNSELTINGKASWADFPGVATDGSAIYVTANMFDHATGNYQGSRLWVVNESTLAKSAAYDPSVLSGAASSSGGDFFTLQPAQIYGAPAGSGTYLVAYDGARSSTASGKALNIIHVTNPFAVGGPTFSYQQVNVGNIDSAGQYASFLAPQRGTSTAIDAGDNRALSAVWRNGSLYVTADVIPPSGPDAGHVTAHWFQVSTTGSKLALSQQGNVSGAAIGSGVRTYYPSIAVDANGDVVVNVSASGPGLYASAYYAVHLAGDAAGTTHTPVAFASGVAPYVRTFGGGDNRWGDFSSVTVDPANPSGFWLFNEYATTQGTVIQGESGRWATKVADVTIGGSTAAPLVASATTGGSTSFNGASVAQFVQSMAAFDTGGPVAWNAGPRGDAPGLGGLLAGGTRHHG
jgi:hypothetical protein